MSFKVNDSKLLELCEEFYSLIHGSLSAGGRLDAFQRAFPNARSFLDYCKVLIWLFVLMAKLDEGGKGDIRSEVGGRMVIPPFMASLLSCIYTRAEVPGRGTYVDLLFYVIGYPTTHSFFRRWRNSDQFRIWVDQCNQLRSALGFLGIAYQNKFLKHSKIISIYPYTIATTPLSLESEGGSQRMTYSYSGFHDDCAVFL